MINPPLIDRRSRQDISAQVRSLLPRYVPQWIDYSRRKFEEGNPGGRDPGENTSGDMSHALIEVFARFVEILIERLNRSADKNFLAYLDMLGVSLTPPKAARVPVQILLAAGAKQDGLVPASTPLATQGPNSLTFETETLLRVTRSRLLDVISYDSRRDRYSDRCSGGT